MIFTVPWPATLAGSGASGLGLKTKRYLPEIKMLVTAMRNTQRIEKGDVLTLPFYSEIDENSVATAMTHAMEE